MDDPALPPDPRDWPSDPFALLGVPRAVGETDLKRAYTRLIRKYKPEHKPEEFRRIREAYEAAVEMSRWYRDAPPVSSPFLSPPFEPPGPFVPVEAPSEPLHREPAETHHETQIDRPVRPIQVDPVEDAWADAVAGDWTAAYSALVALAAADPHRADLPLRLYWLLALRPTLDSDRTRHDWLAAALEVSRLADPAAELYTRELAADSNALSFPYLRLLELNGVPADRLLATARVRFATAAAEGRWAAVEVDLEVLAHRADELDETGWLSYLTDLACRAAYSQTPVAARCATLLAGLKHMELRHAWAFDRVDEQQAAGRVWRESTTVPDPIRRAVAVAWAGGDWRESLATVAAWAAADPLGALRRCDRATREGATVLSALAQLLAARYHQTPAEPEYPSHLIRGLVRAHLTNNMRHDYVLMREELLLFLLAERIDPDELITACAGDSAYRVRSIVEHVRDDSVLRLVYRVACAG